MDTPKNSKKTIQGYSTSKHMISEVMIFRYGIYVEDNCIANRDLFNLTRLGHLKSGDKGSLGASLSEQKALSKKIGVASSKLGKAIV